MELRDLSGAKPPPRIEIARIDECREGGGVTVAMVMLGLIGMGLALWFETSAIRLAAWASIWTGWNVLALMVQNAVTTRRYVVTREAPPAEDG